MARKRPDALARRRSSYPTASLAPDAAASASRCGHSISTGATARNSGPGKSSLCPMPASAIASSATISAMRSASSVEQNGSTGTKSTVPAIVVLRLSFGKRVMRRMPDSPAVSFAQLSALPAPSEVMTPMPVTTTTGRPLLSREDAICFKPPSPHRLDQRHALAAPVADGGDGDLVERTLIRLFDPGGVRRRKQLFATDRERGKRNIQGKLRLEAVAERAAGRAHRHAGQALKPGTLLGGCGFGAGRPRDHGDAPASEPRRQALPHPAEHGRGGAGGATRSLRQHGREPRQRLRAARLGVAARLQNEECAERAEHHAGGARALPDRPECAAQHVSAGVVEQQQIMALAVVRAAHQREVALARVDSRERNAY